MTRKKTQSQLCTCIFVNDKEKDRSKPTSTFKNMNN